MEPTRRPQADRPTQSIESATDTVRVPVSIGVPGTRYGRYEVVRELGRGAMGIVYLARDVELGRPVALKLLNGFGGDETELRRRFEREARLASQLRHPGLVPVYEAGVEGGFPYMAMAYVEGGTFADALDAPLPVAGPARDDAVRGRVRQVQQVACAVAVAHQAGVIHRDLKPANILVEADGTPRVTDFGLATRLDGTRLTAAGTMVGTPAYMPPEQARGGELDVRADVYALGAILYHALTGQPPYDGDDALAVVRELLEGPPSPPRAVDASIDRALEGVCLTAMARRVEGRYDDAGVLADDLARWLAGEPPTAVRRPPVGSRLTRTTRRRLRSAGGLGVVALVAGALVGLWPRPALLTVEVTPPSATVRVDGAVVTAWPLRLAPGRHTLRVERSGHRLHHEPLELRRGERLVRQLQLVPQVATLVVEATPAARVRLVAPDGAVRRGRTPWGPLQLAPGRYRVRLEAPGHRPTTVAVALADGVTRRLAPTLPSAVRWQRRVGAIDDDLLAGDLDGDGVAELVVPTSMGWVIAVRAATGELHWRAVVGAGGVSDPAWCDLGGDAVPDIVLGHEDGRLLLIDGASGRLRSLTQRTYVRPAQRAEGQQRQPTGVLGLGHRGRLFSIAPDGRVRWARRVAAKARQGPLWADLDRDGTLELVVLTQSSLSLHQVATGAPRWTVPLRQSPQSAPVAGDTDGDGLPELLFGCRDGSVYCLSAADQAVRWRFVATGRVVASPVVVPMSGGGPVVVVASEGGHVSLLDGKDGAPLWRSAAELRTYGAPAVGDVTGDGRVDIVVATLDGAVHVLDLTSGRSRWQGPVGDKIESRPRLIDIDGDGVLEIFCGSREGRLTCLQLVRRGP